MAEFALQRSDRRVLLVGAGRHHVHHRGQIEVDAGQPQLPPQPAASRRSTLGVACP